MWLERNYHEEYSIIQFNIFDTSQSYYKAFFIQYHKMI